MPRLKLASGKQVGEVTNEGDKQVLNPTNFAVYKIFGKYSGYKFYL